MPWALRSSEASSTLHNSRGRHEPRQLESIPEHNLCFIPYEWYSSPDRNQGTYHSAGGKKNKNKKTQKTALEEWE